MCQCCFVFNVAPFTVLCYLFCGLLYVRMYPLYSTPDAGTVYFIAEKLHTEMEETEIQYSSEWKYCINRNWRLVNMSSVARLQFDFNRELIRVRQG